MYIDTDNTSLPDWVWRGDSDEPKGAANYFWGLLFAFLVLFPMSIPRSVNALRFSSLFGVLCSMYLCLAVTLVFFTNRSIVPSPSENLKQIQAFKFSYNGVVTTFPLIIFAYMYQVNIPMIYVELEKRNAS